MIIFKTVFVTLFLHHVYTCVDVISSTHSTIFLHSWYVHKERKGERKKRTKTFPHEKHLGKLLPKSSRLAFSEVARPLKEVYGTGGGEGGEGRGRRRRRRRRRRRIRRRRRRRKRRRRSNANSKHLSAKESRSAREKSGDLFYVLQLRWKLSNLSEWTYTILCSEKTRMLLWAVVLHLLLSK